MDERDRELLAVQMRQCSTLPPVNAALPLFGLALFVSGLVLRSFLFASTDRTAPTTSTQIASQHMLPRV